MTTLLIIALAVGLVSADIGIDYKYKVPQTTYGVPSYRFGGNSAEYNTGYAGGRGAGSNYIGQFTNQENNVGQQNSGYQATNSGSLHGAKYQPGTGSQHYQPSEYTNSFSSGTGASVAQPSYEYRGDFAQGGYQTFNQYHTASQYQTSGVHNHNKYYSQLQQQPPQVFKHFYIHAAPEEPEPPKYRQQITLPPPQKHYKIIFIKTPSQPEYPPQYIPVQQQNEEKTIVYVLVKNPEEPQEITIPKVEPKPPAKPEVFFIKYSGKDDSQAVINNIVNDYNKVESVSFTGTNDASGQYIGTDSGQYVLQPGGSGQYAQTDGSGQYTQTDGSGQYVQSTGAAQFVASTESTGSGQYIPPGTGQNTDNAGSGQYTQSTSSSLGAGVGQGVQTASQASALSFGSQSSGGQAFSVSTADSSVVNGGSSGLTSVGATSSSASSVNFEDALSTSQGVPHESYGPPKFRPFA